MIKDLSAKLVAAAAAINTKSREAYVAEQQSLESRKKPKMPMQPVPKADPAAVTTAKKMAEAVEGSVPKTPKEKELAAKSGNPKRITFGDVLKARGVQKEEVERLNEVHVLDDEGETHVHVKDAKNVRELDRAVAHHLKKHHGFSHQDVEDHYHDGYYSEAPYHHEKPEKGSKPTETRTKEEHAKSVAERVAQMKKDSEMDEGWNPIKHIPKEKQTDAIKTAAKDVKRGSYADRAALLKAGGVKEEKEESAAQEKAEKKPNAFNWRTNPTKLPKKPGELTGHDSKKISTGTVYTKKFTNEDTSYSVEHEMFGEGNTLPGQEAEDGSWVDVMFAEGIKRVPADELFVTEAKVGDSHIHVSPVGGGKYKVHAVGSKFSDGIKVGEHLTDTHLDDFAEMGGKIKHVKPEKKD